ncbi:ABC transporter permease YtrF [Lentibacillus populi]|uniref:ABC transporter permease YtrF n=1 Tax=Lentibacillus populi TaxID=1827502 RepID=A0A9W5TZK5_9BACI|nr:FtsX-like permease family protein [Lentibacillus populi]MBT2214856.1 ABC transporter permease [Virgibacillus dakarensis]GGB47690.1 ABC transporter permease YtrF [Lentibacillus populi]
MRLKDRFSFVGQNIKKNKVRTFMTILATAMGCAFLIVLASIGYGLQQTVVDDTMEQQIVTQIDVHGHEGKDGNYQPLTVSDIEYMESIEGVKAVTRKKNLQQMPVYQIEDYQIEAETVVADFPSELKSGLELHEGRLPKEDNEIVVGYDFANYLHSESDGEAIYDEEGKLKKEYQYKGKLIGKTIKMTVSKGEEAGKEQTQTIPLKIVGMTEKPTREWMEDAKVYISQQVLVEVEAFTGTAKGVIPDSDYEAEDDSNTFDDVKVYAKNLEGVEAISKQLDNANYATYSVVSEMKQINVLFTIAKAGLILVGTIAIVIASIGIYNTMTMAVTERAPDIGIMKAIGANPKTIKQIFLLESSYIGIIGAIIGTIVAYGVSLLVNSGLPLILEMAFDEELPEGLKFSSIPATLVLIAVGICLLVTILSGMRPAKRATKIDVLKAMRREV